MSVPLGETSLPGPYWTGDRTVGRQCESTITGAAVRPPAPDVVIVLGRVWLVQVPAQVAPRASAHDSVLPPPVEVPAVRGPVGHQIVQVLGQLLRPGEVRDVDEGAGRCYLFVQLAVVSQHDGYEAVLQRQIQLFGHAVAAL